MAQATALDMAWALALDVTRDTLCVAWATAVDVAGSTDLDVTSPGCG